MKDAPVAVAFCLQSVPKKSTPIRSFHTCANTPCIDPYKNLPRQARNASVSSLQRCWFQIGLFRSPSLARDPEKFRSSLAQSPVASTVPATASATCRAVSRKVLDFSKAGSEDIQSTVALRPGEILTPRLAQKQQVRRGTSVCRSGVRSTG